MYVVINILHPRGGFTLTTAAINNPPGDDPLPTSKAPMQGTCMYHLHTEMVHGIQVYNHAVTHS